MSEPRYYNAYGGQLNPHDPLMRALYVHVEDYVSLLARHDALVKAAGELAECLHQTANRLDVLSGDANVSIYDDDVDRAWTLVAAFRAETKEG